MKDTTILRWAALAEAARATPTTRELGEAFALAVAQLEALTTSAQYVDGSYERYRGPRWPAVESLGEVMRNQAAERERHEDDHAGVCRGTLRWPVIVVRQGEPQWCPKCCGKFVPDERGFMPTHALRTTEKRLREATHKLVDQVTDLEIESWVASSDRDTHRRLFDEKYALEEHVRQLQMTIAIMRETGRISLTERDNAALVAAGRRRRSEPRTAAEATITPAPAPMQALPARRQRGQVKAAPPSGKVRVPPPAPAPLQLPFRGLRRPEEDEG